MCLYKHFTETVSIDLYVDVTLNFPFCIHEVHLVYSSFCLASTIHRNVISVEISPQNYILTGDTTHWVHLCQVGAMAGMSIGVPPRAMHPSSSKSRLTTNKHHTNFARARRLAPIVTKSSESKVGPVKVPSTSHIGILCHADLKSVKGNIENVGEDSERKENLSSFQIGSCSQSSSCVKVTKVFPEPKENIGTCSSLRCSGTSKKLKSVQSSSSGVLKQVLAVRSKCATISNVAGGSKMTKGGIALGRMQKVTTLGSAAVAEKGIQASSPTNVCISKFRKSGITRQSQGASQEECTFLEVHSAKGISECIGRIVSNQVGIRNLNAKSFSSGGRTGCAKDEHKVLSDQTVVQQGSKRLRMSAFKIENTCRSLPLSEVSCKSEVLKNKVKRKDICIIKTSKEKKFCNKNDVSMKSLSLGDNAESDTLSQLWDSNKNSQNISLASSSQNTSKIRGKPTWKKLLPQDSSIKPVTPVTRALIPDSKGTGSVCKVKYSTKPEKQGKGRVTHLSPIKTLQKRKNTDSGRKHGKVSLRSLTTSVSRFQALSSESNQFVQLEKKRKIFKSKFL